MEQKPVVGVVQVPSGNDQMAQAILDAKESIATFLKAFRHPAPNQGGFHLKVRFERDGQVEHMWLGDLHLGSPSGTHASGVVANDVRLEGFAFGKRVEFEKSEVTDWMFTEDGEIVGGYTTKVLMRLRKRYEGERALSKLHRKFGTKKMVLQ